jgi:transposase
MAIAFTLIETAKLNEIDPQVWFTWVLGRIAGHKITRLEELMPWSYAARAALQGAGHTLQSTFTGRSPSSRVVGKQSLRHLYTCNSSSDMLPRNKLFLCASVTDAAFAYFVGLSRSA